MARPRKGQSDSAAEFVCPECGRRFARAAALGAHRRSAHGVVGARTRARATARGEARGSRARRTRPAASEGGVSTQRSRRSGQDGALDRDALLKAVFPNGIPPSEEVVRSLNAWLDEAERLASTR